MALSRNWVVLADNRDAPQGTLVRDVVGQEVTGILALTRDCFDLGLPLCSPRLAGRGQRRGGLAHPKKQASSLA